MGYIPTRSDAEINNATQCDCCGKKIRTDKSYAVPCVFINQKGEYTKIILCMDCQRKYEQEQDQALINQQIEFYKNCKLTDKSLLNNLVDKN